METLADKIRKENTEKFEQIKLDLADKVVTDIKRLGSSYIHIGVSDKHDRIEKVAGIYRGWSINKDYRIAAKNYFMEQGFVVIDCLSPGMCLWGYQITL